MDKNALKYTCLFGGGAIRGAAYVGAVKAMDEVGIRPTNLAGSSVGAIVAALMAVGYSYKEIKEVFLDVNFNLFKDLQFGLGPNFALSKGEYFLDWIRELIEKKYYGKDYEKGKNRAVTFKYIEKNLTIITTDISNFECQAFSKTNTPDFEIATAVRISSSMPGLMTPYEYNKELLVDGDLQKSMPMWKLSDNLYREDERILEFRLEGDDEGSDKNALDYMNTVYSCITSICTSYIAELYGHKDKFDYIVINTGNVLLVDFNIPKEKREELMKSGYAQTMEYFKNVLPKKKEDLLEKYYYINKHLKRIEKLICANKIPKAKFYISEMFVELCDYKDTIDMNIYSDIRNFNELFVNNIKYPPLFGKVKLGDSKIVKDSVKQLIEKVSSKVYEIESYLDKFPI